MQCCGSGLFIPDPGSRIQIFHPGSRVTNQPVSGSRIRILNFYPSRIPDSGSRGKKGTEFRIPDRDPQHLSDDGENKAISLYIHIYVCSQKQISKGKGKTVHVVHREDCCRKGRGQAEKRLSPPPLNHHRENNIIIDPIFSAGA